MAIGTFDAFTHIDGDETGHRTDGKKGTNMFRVAAEKDGISITLSSEAEPRNRANEACESFLHECGFPDCIDVGLVFRELLTNAIIHGNQSVRTRMVHCAVERVDKAEFRVTVEDEGVGFDYESLDTTIPEDPRTMASRGFPLVKAICERIEFNEKGNRVVAHVNVNRVPETDWTGSTCGTATAITTRERGMQNRGAEQ